MWMTFINRRTNERWYDSCMGSHTKIPPDVGTSWDWSLRLPWRTQGVWRWDVSRCKELLMSKTFCVEGSFAAISTPNSTSSANAYPKKGGHTQAARERAPPSGNADALPEVHVTVAATATTRRRISQCQSSALVNKTAPQAVESTAPGWRHSHNWLMKHTRTNSTKNHFQSKEIPKYFAWKKRDILQKLREKMMRYFAISWEKKMIKEKRRHHVRNQTRTSQSQRSSSSELPTFVNVGMYQGVTKSL